MSLPYTTHHQTPPDSPRYSSRLFMSADRDPSRVVDSLVDAVRNLASDDNYKVVADVFKEAQDLRSENARLATSQRDILEGYRKFRNELEAKETKLLEEAKELQSAIEKKDAQVEQLKSECSKLDAEVEKGRRRLDEESQKCLELADKKDDLEKTILKLQGTLDEKDKSLAELQEAKSRVDAELVDIKEGLVSMTKELAGFEAAKVDLESQLADTKSSLDQKSQELATLQGAKSAVETQLTEANAQLEGKAKEAEELTAAKEALTSELADTHTKLDNKTKEFDELASQLADVNTKLEEKSRELDDLSKAQAAFDTQLSEVTAKLDAEQGAKKAVEDELQKAKESLEQEAARASILSDEVAAIRQTLQDRNDEMDQLKGELALDKDTLEKAEAALKKLGDINSGLEKELQAKTAKLDEISGYQVQLNHEPEDSCVEILDTIWVSILELVEKHFGQTLEDSVLRDPSCWTNLHSSDYLKNAIRVPLPHSNSIAAKQMRIAAVLAVLSRALTRHIFRPSYLIDKDASGELVQVLRKLEAVSPAQELHTRSTLLAVLPELQKRNAGRQVKVVVREVSYVVQHLLSALQYEAFCTALEETCGLACRQWQRIQRATMKVEPYFGPPYDDFDWQVLLLPEKFGTGLDGEFSGSSLGLDAGSSTISGNGRSPGQDSGSATAAAAAAAAAGGGGDDTSTIAESIHTVVDPGDIMLVLWPSMCAAEHGELVSITQGLVMAKDQAGDAFEEEGRKRLPHKIARSMSQSRKPKSVAGSPRPGRAHSHRVKSDADSVASGGHRGSRNGGSALAGSEGPH